MIALSDLVRVSCRQVVRQRGIGVVLSIALGITAFIVLSVLGREIRFMIGKDMVLMGGVNIIQLYMDDDQYPGQPKRSFTREAIAAVEKLPGVGMVSKNMHGFKVFPLRGAGMERMIYMRFIGVDENFAPLYSLKTVAGRFFTAEDMEKHSRVCMLGIDSAKNLFGNENNALGKYVFLGPDVFTVIGVVSGVMMGDWRECGFLPWTCMEDRSWGDGKITRLFIRAVTWEDVPRLIRVLQKTVRA
ncbi:MAG: ABC transporter permease, partial [Desulfovibrio sp.]|nr:ABC transporter permease [Desulfovibrio sp.]